jgi:hypothetical protein
MLKSAPADKMTLETRRKRDTRALFTDVLAIIQDSIRDDLTIVRVWTTTGGSKTVSSTLNVMESA